MVHNLKNEGVRKTVWLSEEIVTEVTLEANRQRRQRETGEPRISHSTVIEEALRQHFGMK